MNSVLGMQKNIRVEKRDPDGKIIITDGNDAIIPDSKTTYNTLRKMGSLSSPSGITNEGLVLVQMMDKIS